MNREELVAAAMATDLEAEQACGPQEQQFLIDAAWAYKVAYLMLIERADLLWTEARNPAGKQ